MKSILIDTNIYNHALKGDAETISILQQAQRIGICSISIGELLSGFKAGKGEKKTEKSSPNFWIRQEFRYMLLMKIPLNFMLSY